MRKAPNAASLARLVAALFAAPVIAHAMPAVHSFGTSSTATSSGTTSNTPAAAITSPAPSSSSSGSGTGTGTGTGTVIAPTNTGTVDQRNAQTTNATQANRASGNTAASQMASAASGGPTTQGSSGSATVNSSTGGTTTGGTTTGGTGSGTGTSTGTGGTVGLLGGAGVVVNSGEPAVDANGNIIAPPTYAANTPNANYAVSSYNMASNGTLGADVVVADSTMNQVIGTAKRDRKRVGRNGQLLYSIAPRTSVDRTAQMPDDGPTPALTGPLAR